MSDGMQAVKTAVQAHVAQSDHMRGDFAANVTGDIPGRCWHDMLYERSIAAVCGPSGVGKSTIVTRIVADFSATVGNVIYGNAEDDRVMQRFKLEAAGASMDKVRLASYVITAESDMDELEYAIIAQKVKLVVFDTAAKHIDGPMQRWDRPLVALHHMLQRVDCMALLVHHTNKNVKKSMDWQGAVGGATAGLIGTVRTLALVGKRPDNPDHVLYCPAKDSYAPAADAIAFEFQTEDLIQANGDLIEVPYMTIAEKGVKVANKTALVVVQGEGDGKKGPAPEAAAAAAQFLQETLANGPHPLNDVYLCKTNPDSTKNPDDKDWKSRDCGHMAVHTVEAAGGKCPGCDGKVTQIEGIKSKAEAAMVSMGTIKRAKGPLMIDTDCKGFSKDRVQYWSLPDGHPSLIAGPRNVTVKLDSGDVDAGGNPIMVDGLSSLPLA